MNRKQEKVAVIGAGSWGTALAIVLADNGHEVRLWGHNADQIDEINQTHSNKKYLPDIELPVAIKGYSSLAEALTGLEIIVLAVPTKAIREVIRKMVACNPEPFTIVHVSKGIEPDSLLRISEIIEQEMPESLLKDVVVLSGPSHAEEVSLR
ncbi:MAG: NAD(P)-binding domain-containing protein, partial [Bacillus sp. (in: firmicutes)]